MLFRSHLDTVSLCKGAEPILVDNKIISNTETALGADNRGGVGCLVNMLKYIFRNEIDYYPMTILFTPCAFASSTDKSGTPKSTRQSSKRN